MYAIDAHCYHAGGPLDMGHVEDIEGLVSSSPGDDRGQIGGRRPCVVCPWHHYKITLDTGEGVYMGIDPFTKPPKREIKSKGCKQRVHRVVIDEASGDVMVEIECPKDSDDEVDSDYYSGERFRGLMRSKSGVSVRVTSPDS